MLKTQLEKILSTSLSIEKMNKGITNQNYLVTTKQGKFVARISYPHQDQIVNRKQEEVVIHVIATSGLDVKQVYFNVETGWRITEFVENLLEYQEATFLDKVERTAALMSRLHQLPSVPFSFNPIERFYQYQTALQTPIYDCSPYLTILDEVKHCEKRSCLCHNDWVSGNILFGLHQDYLIDYEYAAMNDPFFDIMSFFTENQITEPTLRQRFYQAYLHRQPTQKELHDLEIWECFHHLLWCTWAMLMNQYQPNEIVKNIAQDKWTALQQCFKKRNR